MASILHDPKVFEEADKFKPERYLTGDITLKKKRTIPFGIGKHVLIINLGTIIWDKQEKCISL